METWSPESVCTKSALASRLPARPGCDPSAPRTPPPGRQGARTFPQDARLGEVGLGMLLPEPVPSEVTGLPGLPGLPGSPARPGLALRLPAMLGRWSPPGPSIPPPRPPQTLPAEPLPLQGRRGEASDSVWRFASFLTPYPAPKRKELK